VTVPDYIALGVLIDLIVWAVADWIAFIAMAVSELPVRAD